MKYISFLILFLFTTVATIAQGAQPDMMRADHKIYVVVAVLLIIFLGIVVFLLNMERRVKKLEG